MEGNQIDMSVAQFFQHFGQNLEELLVCHVVRQAVAVTLIDFIPIESVLLMFVLVEAIFGVDDLPKGFEVAPRGIVGYIFCNAGGEKESQYDCHPEHSEGIGGQPLDAPEILRFAQNDIMKEILYRWIYHIFLFIRID